MCKKFLLTVLLAASPAIAQDPFLTGDALAAAVKAECAAGCVVITREDAARLEAHIRQIALQAYMAGEEAGAKAAEKSCVGKTI